MQMMRNSFTDQLKIIKEDGAKHDTEAKRRIADAEQTYNKAQEAMLTEYKTIRESITESRTNYNMILERQNKLSIRLQTRDNETRAQSNAFAQVLLSLYTSMSTGTPPAPLTQDIIDSLTPAMTEMEIKEHGTGAPGMDTKHSSTDHYGGGQSN